MQDNWKDKLRLFLRHRIPLLITFMLMFIFFVPINSLEVNLFRPAVGFICVYYWTLKRSYIFSYFSAFCVGFLVDVYSSTPFGVNILTMMLLVAATEIVTRYFSAISFGASWVLFGVIGLPVILIKWLLMMVYFRQIIVFREILIGFSSTVMFYPLIAYINAWVQSNLLPQERINE
jgi:rod shape-determining protein MreD